MMLKWARAAMSLAMGVEVGMAGHNLSGGHMWMAWLNLLCGVFIVMVWRRAERSRAATNRFIKSAILMVESEYAPRPEGVRVVRADGTETPCELVYRGQEDGQYLWDVAGVVLRKGDMVRVDMMPGLTSIEIQREP